MKKLNYLMLGLAGLTMISCSQDDLSNANGIADGNYQVTINLPADVATRAIGDNAKAAQLLNYAIFDDNGTYVSQGTANFGGNTSMTLPLSLVSGTSFKIAFFAQSPESTNVYKFNAGATAHSVTVDYEEMESTLNNADGYDCFYEVLETGVIGSPTMKTEVTLNRIVAQINWGTSDYNQATVTNTYGTNLASLNSTLTVTVPNEFDLLTGKTAGEPQEIKIGSFTPDNATTAEKFPVTGYQYVAMQYVLVPADKGLYNLNLAVSNEAGTADNPITVDNAPVQANYRTNIYGNLLTDNIQFQVDLSADWGTPGYTVAEDFAALQTALNYSTPGSVVYLNNDMVISSSLFVTKAVELNLNGHTLTYSGNSGSGYAAFLVNGTNSNLTISGEGTVTSNVEAPLVWVYNGGTVTIEGGTFDNPLGHCVYLGARSTGGTGGTANISGGSFKSSANADYWALNIMDGYVSSSKFNVTGGMYYNFNPQNNASDGQGTNYVVDGYQAVATTINGDTWYVVVPEAEAGESVKVATSTTDVASAIENASGNTTIYVTPNTTVQLPASISGKTLSFVGLDPETSHVYGNMAYWNTENCNLSFENITIESFVNSTNHTSMGFNNAESQTFKNVTFIGEFHVFTGTASFKDCTFDYDKTTGTNYALWCDSDETTDITNCTMNCNDGKAILVYAGQGASYDSYGGNVNINGLTVTSTGSPSDKAVVEIHSEKYIGAGTITISNVTYPASFFSVGLWQEVYNEAPYKGEKTTYYKVIVDGQTVQDGGSTGKFEGNGQYNAN